MSYPVTFEADYAEGRNRLTAFFRLILVIPVAILLYFYAIVASLAIVVAWLVIVFTARFPQLYDFVAGYSSAAPTRRAATPISTCSPRPTRRFKTSRHARPVSRARPA